MWPPTRASQRHGGVDIVISKVAARISPAVPQAEQVARFVDTNNHGTYRVLKAFMPLVRDGGRLLVVASAFGTLRNLPPHLHGHFDVARATPEEIEGVMDEYARLVETGQDGRYGWPEWMNVPSTIGQVAAIA
jgi:carbonyl reductase 1